MVLYLTPFTHMTGIFNISVYACDLFIFILLIFSLLYCYKDLNPRYLRTFPIYCLVNAMAEVFSSLSNHYYFFQPILIIVLFTTSLPHSN